MTFPPFPFVVLDTETTGFTPRADRILELALVRYEAGKKVAEYESLYQVDRDIPPHVQVLTRIRPMDVQGKPTFTEEKEHVLSLLKGAVIVGQNILFDRGMLRGEGADLADAPWIDTAMLASLVFPELPSWSLGYLSVVLPLPHEPRHRAMGDVRATEALFMKEWERLSELTPSLFREMAALAQRGPEGYRLLFSSVGARGKRRPSWVSRKQAKKAYPILGRSVLPFDIAAMVSPLTLVSSPLSPTFLPSLLTSIATLPMHHGKRVWVAVKNIEAVLRSLPEDILSVFTVLYPEELLLHPAAWEAFLTQEAYTADELTLAIKLHLFMPRVQGEVPIHGEERDVWKGKLACTKNALAYRQQFMTQGKNILIDHRQLLELLALNQTMRAAGDTDAELVPGPQPGDCVIVDDASMLEDTATKAFRWFCSIDTLRAGTLGNGPLQSFLDAYQMWVEKIRNVQDVRYLIETDLTTPAAQGLRERLKGYLTEQHLEQIRQHLEDLLHILTPKNITGRIVWVEQFRDGGNMLQSVPLDVGEMLREVLYERYQTVLLLPPFPSLANNMAKARAFFSAILPRTVEVHLFDAHTSPHAADAGAVSCVESRSPFEEMVTTIDSRVVALIASKRAIEEFFVKYAEKLEDSGITFIAQGLGGGVGKMQAEFLAGGKRALWLLTPWAYEGVELPPGSIDHLWIHTLPFDHPSHTVLSRRAECFGNAFEEYLLPRLLHRLFRILRTFGKHRTPEGDLVILDQRVWTKKYGTVVRTYLQQITSTSPSPSGSGE